MWWDDDAPLEEGTIRRLTAREMLGRIWLRMRTEKRAFAISVLFLLLAVSAELAGPLILRRLIDTDIPASVESGNFGAILQSAAFYLAIFLIGSIATYGEIIVITKMGLSIIARLKQELFDHLLSLGADYYDTHPPGRLMARVESDTERIANLFSDVSLALTRSLVMLFGTLAIMLWTDVRITLTVMALIAPTFLASFFFVRKMRTLYGRVRKVYTRLSTFVTEYVQAVPILQVYGRRNWAMSRLGQRHQDRLRMELGTSFVDYGFWSLFATIEIIAVMLILYLGFRPEMGDALTLGTTVLFVEYTRRLFRPLVMFAEQLNFVQRAFASADRVFGILDTPSRVIDRPGVNDTIPREWKELRFENVSFAYDAPPESTASPTEEARSDSEPATTEFGIRALDGVSFAVRKGETIALVGPSGGGKSTLVQLLLRFYEPTSGRITLDGVDLREYTQRAWRAQIGLVLQDVHLFPGSVRDNLRVFDDAVEEERLMEAAREIDADSVLARFARGLDTDLAEGGQNLSMGERQLVCFSRAMVKQPSLLILDEATSSVDPMTERRIQKSLEKMTTGRTALIVAHRLSTITSADRILALEKGRIVQSGSHAELLAEGGLYKRLYRLQFQSGDVA